MTLPRPALLAILGGVLILAVFAVTRVAAQPDEGAAPSAPDTAAQQAAPSGSVRSGELNVGVVVREDGGEVFRARFGGPFQSRGATSAPAFDFDLDMSGEKVGVVSTGDRGWVTAGDTAYEIPAEGWRQITAVREQIARLGAQASEGDAQPAALLELDELLVGERRAGTETIDGVETVHSTGRVDVARALREIQDAAALQPGALPGDALRELRSAVGDVRAETYVGAEDKILRRFVLRFELAGAKATLTVDLTEVNAAQSIEAPAEVDDPSQVPGDDLALALGMAGGAVAAIDPPPGADKVDPSRVSASSTGEPRATADPGRADAGEGLPAGVARALRAKRVVVLVFTQGGAEDDAVRDAVGEVRGRRGVSVFSDRVEDITDYRRVVGELEVDRAPAVVIVRRDGKAEVVEGYIDAGSLVQQVEDAR